MLRFATTAVASLILLAAGGSFARGSEVDGVGGPATQVEALASEFGIAFLRLDGHRACPLMTVTARHRLVEALQSYLEELGAPNAPRHCPRALGTLSAFTGAVGPNATFDAVRRDRRKRREQIRRLRRGDGVGAVTVDGAEAHIAQVPRLGALIAVDAGGQWLVSELIALRDTE